MTDCCLGCDQSCSAPQMASSTLACSCSEVVAGSTCEGGGGAWKAGCVGVVAVRVL